MSFPIRLLRRTWHVVAYEATMEAESKLQIFIKFTSSAPSCLYRRSGNFFCPETNGNLNPLNFLVSFPWIQSDRQIAECKRLYGVILLSKERSEFGKIDSPWSTVRHRKLYQQSMICLSIVLDSHDVKAHRGKEPGSGW
ncbi:uncharacterized protein ARMOST_15926 [Armillaria ostoyae]|uniref:Uncharacterized protein n=1 Tax=Armillaria ostoyae TaxID=47428 RepID=A0A284RUQ6_ARMOS|nr:uncharacterized protein ARMOST_15926 [Armillaria ostoyae]